MPTGPQRLILINSGRYEYADVELAGALQIVGPNNTGKTTLINTLQFLYIDDRRHMDFGSYTSEETRGFYFPNQYSYILFECLGATGQCVIGWRGQSKTSGGEPERFFHAGPFAATDFLGEMNQVREPRDVNARLALKEFRIIKSAQEQKELLLPAVNGDGRGLGIVALRDTDKYHHFRETLKNLLTLSAITQEQMRDRLLMLADIPPDRTAFDARELFGDDYDRIRTRREQLVKFKKNQALVEKLVGKFGERETARGELVWRSTDLCGKRQKFEKEHEKTLMKLREKKSAQEKKVKELEAELTDRRNDVALFSVEKGKLDKPLEDLKALDKVFAPFAEDLEHAALANLKQEIRTLETQLANAESESHEKAKRNFDVFTGLVKQKQQTIAHFDHLAVTALRKHFKDNELSIVFRILNRELLELPVGKDGIAVSRQKELLAALRCLLDCTQDGVYRDANVSFPLPKTGEPLAGLENLDTAREQLADYQSTLKRWKETLTAIEQREKLETQRKAKLAEVAAKEKRLFQFGEYQTAKANEPRLRAELKKIECSIAAANERIGKLSTQYKVTEKAKTDTEGSIRKQEDEFNVVMGNFNDCIPPEFSAKQRVAEGIPDDFDAAIALFLRQQEKQGKLCDEITNLLILTEQWFGTEFRGEDEYETVGTLQAELEALAEKEEALARDWNAHIHGLKATFDLVLKNLDHVRSAATGINRAFSKVQVSNLKAVKLEVVEQSDLVSWIKRLAAFEPGGLFDADPQQESAIINFRRTIQDNPVIRFTNLFTLGFTVTGADDQRHTYHDFRQIESHGTTITIKVLFNLLLLKDQLRRDDCAVPFFLDEIQTLDPANRHAILRTARQLGFIAITAAPEPVSEVDAIYFLQPQKGRIVLRHKHRATVKRTSAASER
jgi:predicted  nucleic acid-binding Zn-ribbon protein